MLAALSVVSVARTSRNPVCSLGRSCSPRRTVHVIREHGIKGHIVEREALRGVRLLEVGSRGTGLALASGLALSTPGAFTSTPTTLQPTFSAMCKAYPPDPHPTSNTDELATKRSIRGISVDSSVVTQLVCPRSWP